MVTDAGTHAQPSLDGFAGTLQRAEIQDQPSSIPGREIVQVLTELPAGVESGWHTGGEEVQGPCKVSIARRDLRLWQPAAGARTLEPPPRPSPA
jgi:hypothetical protein